MDFYYASELCEDFCLSMFIFQMFFFTFQKKSPSTFIVQENPATLFCCGAQDIFSWTMKLTQSYRHGHE